MARAPSPVEDQDWQETTSSPMKFWRNPIRLILAMLLGTALCFALTVWQSQRIAEDQAQEEAARLANLVAEHVAEVVQTLEQALTGLSNAYRFIPVDPNLGPAMASAIAEKLITLPRLEGLAIFTLDGAPVTSSVELGQIGAAIGREIASQHLIESGLLISGPFRHPEHGGPVLVLSRAVIGSDGKMTAIAAALAEPGYFSMFYSTLNLGESGTVNLARNDGRLLARLPADDVTIGSILSESSLFDKGTPQAATGSFHEVSRIDGISRYFGFAKVPGRELIATVGITEDYVLREWRRIVIACAVLLLGITLSLSIPLWLFSRQRQSARAAIAASDLRFQELADRLPGVVFALTGEQAANVHFTFVSRGSVEILGLSPEALLDQRELFFEKLESADRAKFFNELDLSRSSLVPWAMEFKIISPAGFKWIQAISHPSRDANGHMNWHGFLFDVTTRKQVDATLDAVRGELQEKNRQFDIALNNMVQGLTLYDADGQLLVFNDRYRELYNFPSGFLRPNLTIREIMEMSVALGNYPRERAQEVIEERLRIGQSATARKFYQVLASGRTIEVNFRPLPYGGSVSTFEDVTEAKAREAELAAKSSLLQVTLERIDEGISVFDAQARLVAWNDQFFRVLELPDHLARVGTRFEDFVAYQISVGEFTREYVEPLDQASMAGRSVAWERTRPNGRVLECLRNPMPNGGFVTVFRDVTEIKQAQGTLRIAKEQAEQADRAKSVFLANMSHELRTPLNAIIGFSEIIRDELYGPLGDGRYAEYARDIHDSGSHLLALINDVLDMSKIEAGRMEMEQEEIDITRLIDGCRQMIRQRAEEGHVEIENINHGLQPKVLGDERALKQVLLNILSNSIKFTPPGGRITIEFVRLPDGLDLIIADTGIGIAPEALMRVMQPFAQAEAGISRKYGGTGLGLSISKALAEMHQGKLSIESELGHGTKVHIFLPKARISYERVSRAIAAR